MNFEDLVFKSEINLSIRFQEAPSHNKTLSQYAPKAKAVVSYDELADEVILRSKAFYKQKVVRMPAPGLKEASA